MNNLHIRKTAFVLVLVGLCLSGQCHAATSSAADADNDSGLSVRQILKMGLERFTNVYCSQPQHRHHPAESAAQLYQKYKQPDNQRRITHFTLMRKRQVASLYAALRDWKETAWQLRYDYGGGGTAWISDMICSSAETDELIGRIISLYERVAQQAGQHCIRPDRAMRGCHALLDHCEKWLAHKSVDIVDDSEHRNDLRRTLPAFRKQTASLNEALKLQPLVVQRLVGKHLNALVDYITR